MSDFSIIAQRARKAQIANECVKEVCEIESLLVYMTKRFSICKQPGRLKNI